MRDEKKLTQADVAKVIDVAPSTIGMYEQGRRMPDADALGALADYFEVTTDYLLGRTDDRSAKIEMHAVRNPNVVGMSVDNAIDIISQLERLSKLHDDGKLTTEEFESLKKKLLS